MAADCVYVFDYLKSVSESVLIRNKLQFESKKIRCVDLMNLISASI